MSTIEVSKSKDRRITLSDWFRKRKETLRDKCARYGLSVIGKKPLLAERVYMYLHGESAASESLSQVQESEESPTDVQLLNLSNEGFSLLSTANSQSGNRSLISPSKHAASSQPIVPPQRSAPAQLTSLIQTTAPVFTPQTTTTSTTSTAPLFPPQTTPTSTTFHVPLDELRQLIREEFQKQQQQNPVNVTTQAGITTSTQLPIMPLSLPGQLSPASSLPPETTPAPAHTTNLYMPISTSAAAVPFHAAPTQQQQHLVQSASVGKNNLVFTDPPPSTLPPLSDKAVKAMENYDYIDLSTLLPNSLYENPVSDNIVQLCATEGNLFSATQSVSTSLKKPKITTVAEWLEAWNIYIRGMVHFHPNLAPLHVGLPRVYL